MHKYHMIRHNNYKNTKDIIIESDEFIFWIKGIINFYTDICLHFKENISKDMIRKIEILPKCLVDITRLHCKCQSKCLDFLSKKIKFNNKCLIFNLTEINNEKLYTDCNFLSGLSRLNNDEYKILIQDFSKNLYKNIKNLCYNEEFDFSEVHCQALDLRDHCANDKLCINYFMNEIAFSNCTNKYYQQEINKFKDILSLEKFENIDTSESHQFSINYSDFSFFDKVNSRKLLSFQNYNSQNNIDIIVDNYPTKNVLTILFCALLVVTLLFIRYKIK